VSAPKTPPTAHDGQAATPPGGARAGDERFLAHLATAGDMVAGGRFREAEVEVLRALSGLPADLRALNLLALVRFKLGRVDEARATYREIAAAVPNDATAHRNLGLLAIKLEQVDDAIPELEMAARLAPGDKQAWGYLGYAYAKKGEPVPAAAAFRRAGQDVLAAELENAATARHLDRNPERVPGTSGGRSGGQSPPSLGSPRARGGTPPPAAAPAGLDGAAKGGTPRPSTAPQPLVLPAPTTPPRPRARTAEGRAVSGASVIAAAPSGLFAAPASAAALAPLPIEVSKLTIAPPAAAPAAVAPEPTAALEEGGAPELAPVPLLGFVLSRLGLGASPPAPRGEALRLGVGDEAYVRAGAALAAVGVRFEPAFRRAQGRRSSEPLVAQGAPFFRLVGPGDVWVAGNPGRWQAVSLEDDILYVREDRVLAFDGGVSWEAGAVPGDGLRMLQFRGRGCVVLRLDAPPLAVKVTEDRPALVGRDHLIGWVGRLVTHRQRIAGATPFELACQGEGVVLFDPHSGGAASHG
jgi:uncharacterized protein (AIM24 family)/Tfp pilus assembly protein PilF